MPSLSDATTAPATQEAPKPILRSTAGSRFASAKRSPEATKRLGLA